MTGFQTHPSGQTLCPSFPFLLQRARKPSTKKTKIFYPYRTPQIPGEWKISPNFFFCRKFCWDPLESWTSAPLGDGRPRKKLDFPALRAMGWQFWGRDVRPDIRPDVRGISRPKTLCLGCVPFLKIRGNEGRITKKRNPHRKRKTRNSKERGNEGQCLDPTSDIVPASICGFLCKTLCQPSWLRLQVVTSRELLQLSAAPL